MSTEVRLTQLMDVPIGMRNVHIDMGAVTVGLRFDPTDATFEVAAAYPGSFGKRGVSPKTKFYLAALLGNMGVTLDDCAVALDEWQRQTDGKGGMAWEKSS